jgi:hypothetical protein
MGLDWIHMSVGITYIMRIPLGFSSRAVVVLMLVGGVVVDIGRIDFPGDLEVNVNSNV